MYIRNFFSYLSPDDAGGGSAGAAAATEVEVDLPEVGKIKLPKDTAALVIKARDAMKESGRKAGERLGALEAEKKAAEDQVKKAAEDKALADAVKNGEIEKIRELSNKSVNALAAKYRDRALENMILGNKAIIPAAAQDIARQLSGSCRFDIDTDTLVVIDAAGKPRVGSDGKPMSVDALLSEFIDPRPYFRQPSGSPGSGAAGGGANKSAAGSMLRATWEKLSAADRAKHFTDGGTLADA